MIPRISKGRSAQGSLRYDHGPGRREEHENPRKVAGNVAGKTWQQRANTMDRHWQRSQPDMPKPVHRTSLRAAPGDRKLTDKQWGQVARSYVNDMGFGECPWEATRHGDDHIHVTVTRVSWGGDIVPDRSDYARAQKAARTIERDHGLSDASRRYSRTHPQPSHGERESAHRRQVRPERDQLRDRLHTAEERSGGTRAGYEQALRDQGVHYRVNESTTTGRVSGYSYGLAGHTDKTGAQVWFKGSQLGQDHSWKATQHRLTQQQDRQRLNTVTTRTIPPTRRAGRHR